MTKSIPKYLYHYTSINTLGFILKNKNIRFNNLTALDDLDEGIHSGAPWGKYFFVSSWTSEEKESIEMWKMYSNDMNGIRIRMKTYPFCEYHITTDIVRQHLASMSIDLEVEPCDYMSLVPIQEILNSRYMFTLINKDKILHQVVYNEMAFQDALKKENILVPQHDGRILFEGAKLGKSKNEFWAFQKEWRYLISILPIFPIEGVVVKGELQRSGNLEPLKRLDNLPFSDYRLNLSEEAFASMEILLGPKTNEIDQEIVRLLVKEYNPTVADKISISCLHNRIR